MIEFLEKLEIVAKSPLAFVAYIAIAVGYVFLKYKTTQLNNLRKLIVKLPNDERIKTVEIKLGRQIDPSKSPQEWLIHKKNQYYLYGLISVLITIIILAAFTTQIKLKRAETSVIGVTSEKEVNFKLIGDKKIIEKTKKLMGAYLSSLTAETFVADDFFATKVDRFFNESFTTSSEIEDYIKSSYYKNFLSRKIYFLENSWQLVDKSRDFCEFHLVIVGSWITANKKTSVKNKTKMRLRINNQYKFVFWDQIAILENIKTNID